MATIRISTRRFDEGNYKKNIGMIIKDLGIKFESSEEARIADCIMLYGCSNIPKNLPPFLIRVKKEI